MISDSRQERWYASASRRGHSDRAQPARDDAPCLRGAFSQDAPGTELRAVVVTYLRFLASRLYTGYGSNPVSRSPAGSLP